MTSETSATPDDLTGTPDERTKQLAQLADTPLSAEWLRRQLESALLAWAADESELDIVKDSRADY
ncbi:hypothetical protein ACEXQE_00640 [Herbiconiux sp. P17]|uniref:hypothetical protein n=1 Tax=Herbiconiux wuyangfengii TaxID=3342794 RepID=UPI0035B9B45A